MLYQQNTWKYLLISFVGILFLFISSLSSKVYASPILNGPILEEDTFIRVNSTSGWGTASNGHTWALLTSASLPGGTIGITSNEGTIKSNTASLFNILNPSVSSADQEGLVRWSINSTNSTAGILLRSLNSSNYYLARYDGLGHIQFLKKVGGTSTATTAVTFTPTLGSFYWIRFQIIGSNIAIKEWADGTSEPASFQYTTTDTSISAANGVGLYGFAGNSTNNTFDSFDVTNPSGATPTPTPTATPTPTPAVTYTLNGTVFVDTNGNGIQDIGETGYQGASIAISGAGTGTTTTDASGNYSFSSLGAGTYTVTLTVPGGYQATTTNPATDPISSNTTTNFGIQLAPTPTPLPTSTPTPLPTNTPTPTLIPGPNITNIASLPTSSQVTITWTTNIVSNDTVLYGVTTNYGSSSGTSGTSVTNHSVIISFLLPCTTYHFEVQSSGTGTNTTTSSDNKFTTTGCTSHAEVVATSEATLTLSSGGTTTLDDGSKEKATVNAPSSSLSVDTTFQIHKVTTSNATASIPTPDTYKFISTNSFEIEGLTTTGTTATYHAPITITLTYNPAELGSTDPTQLVIAHYDNAGWSVLANCSVNTVTQQVSCQTSSFSLFSIVMVQPTSNSSNSSSSSTGNSCTAQPPLSAPILYEIDTILGSASLYFAPASHPYTSYTISYGPENHDDFYAFSFPLTNTTGAINVQVNALTPLRMYTFKVRANNDCAPGAWSKDVAIHGEWMPFFSQKNFLSTPVISSTKINSNTKPANKINNKTFQKKLLQRPLKNTNSSAWWTFLLHLF